MNTSNREPTPSTPIDHAEFRRSAPISNKRLNERSVSAASQLLGPSPTAVEAGLYVADYVRAHEERQSDYHDSYRELFRVAERASLLDPLGGHVGVQSLLDFDARVAAHPDVLDSTLPHMKGVSIELGSVLQLGDWEAGRQLDEEMRTLPLSSRLANAGFDFKTIYDEDRETHRYELKLFKGLGEGGLLLTGVRKRPIADIETAHAEYHLFKHSAFLVKAESTDLTFDEQNNPVYDVRELGVKYLENERQIDSSDHVTPITSKYLALIRSDQQRTTTTDQ